MRPGLLSALLVAWTASSAAVEYNLATIKFIRLFGTLFYNPMFLELPVFHQQVYLAQHKFDSYGFVNATMHWEARDTTGSVPNTLSEILIAHSRGNFLAVFGPYQVTECNLMASASSVLHLIHMTTACLDDAFYGSASAYPYVFSSVAGNNQIFGNVPAICDSLLWGDISFLTMVGSDGDAEVTKFSTLTFINNVTVHAFLKLDDTEPYTVLDVAVTLDSRPVFVGGYIPMSIITESLTFLATNGYQVLMIGSAYAVLGDIENADSSNHWMIMHERRSRTDAANAWYKDFIDNFALEGYASFLNNTYVPIWDCCTPICGPEWQCTVNYDDVMALLQPGANGDQSWREYTDGTMNGYWEEMMDASNAVFEATVAALQAEEDPVDMSVLTRHMLEVDIVDGMTGRMRFTAERGRSMPFQVKFLAGQPVNQILAPPVMLIEEGSVTITGEPMLFINDKSSLPATFGPDTPLAPAVPPDLIKATTATFQWSVATSTLRSSELSSLVVEFQAELQQNGEWTIATTSSQLQGQVVVADLDPITDYSVRVTVTTASGHATSASSSFKTASASCQLTGCLEHAECVGDVCACQYDYATPLEPITTTRACALLFSPCSAEDPCLGTYGSCNLQTGTCDCVTGTELAPIQGALAEEWRLCVLSAASTDDMRKFWTISLWLSCWGFLFSSWMLWEFIFNAQLRHPNSMMQAFIAFAVPDILLSFLNFVVYIEQLVNGDPLGSVTGSGGRNDSACTAVAFLTYTFVIMTYFGPVSVSLFTFLKFRAVAAGRAAYSVRGAVVYSVCVVLPLVTGIILASIALSTRADDGEGVLGSYRGLYCYNRRWEYDTAGLITILFFCLTGGFTVIMYSLTTATVAQVVKESSSAAGSKAPKAIMRRGILLTLTFVCTWIWFTVLAGLGYMSRTIDIQIDMVGAIIINAQPIIDCVLLVTMPNVRADYLTRWSKQAGISSSSSSSSSSVKSSKSAEEPRKS